MSKISLLLSLFLSVIFFSSCQQESPEPNSDADSEVREWDKWCVVLYPAIVKDTVYSGIFYRTGQGDTSNITLSFSAGSFSGTSDTPKYPAICYGSYSVNQEKTTIQFQDSCMWTADFDWTLILRGTFNMEATADELIMTKKVGDQISDVIRLRTE